MTNLLLFYWQAVGSEGQLLRGAFFCQHRQEAMDKLVALDMVPVKLTAGRRYRARDWRWQDKISFFRQIATLLTAGLSLSDALQLTRDGHNHVSWQALLTHLQHQVSNGIPFSDALAQWPLIFPALFPALMQVGEMTGQMDECCLRLAYQQERQLQLQKKVTKALRYPLIVLAIALLVSIGMLIFVLPEFVAVYRAFDTPLPWFTAAIISCSEVLQHYGPILLPFSFIAFAGWQWQHRRSPAWQRKQQQTIIKLPLAGELVRGRQLSKIFMTLALTQQAGLTLLQGLQAVEKTLNQRLWQEAIANLQKNISAGNPLSQALAGHTLFTPICYQLVKVGEEAGSLDGMFSRLGELYESTTNELADSLASALEPVVMVITGIIVGTLVVAMYLPVFNLGNALG
ncbi:protein transport protein HofC [Erwinia psidii]|uniref:Type IV pilin biogenesis protein n=1 Tax=Erwinia psidii TaxID=69224 RepID=A0A3N6S3Z9_9GAMM|nr:protein transport protein HofC [Erwinia psidii]MCX8957575.1 type IV pilin biogenesis protein [Erwinia psidii]MCX8960629.1 type IV pilin biogenesis protein [Erwinia psidii]MCX8964126.1 type IV pilin biogenesis protein [Erwinia psidii]RQM39607.1 type IV pilin biogenesis protein [Erwinia psidii]